MIRFSIRFLTFLAAIVSVPTTPVSAEPSDHSYSLIKIRILKKESDERTKILNAGANWDQPDMHYRPYMKVMALRAADLLDPHIEKTGDRGIAFLKFQYDQYKGKPTGIGYVIVTRNDAGEWKRRWSFDDGGGSRDCAQMFDHMMTARKFMLEHGLDPKKFAPELLPVQQDIETSMREYQGECSGDF